MRFISYTVIFHKNARIFQKFGLDSRQKFEIDLERKKGFCVKS